MSVLKRLAYRLPGAHWAFRMLSRMRFRNSASYWESRYVRGGNSGSGSAGRLATFKAEVVNRFVDTHGIATVVELGCGDGQQLALAQYPSYLGLDVSPAVIAHCREQFAGDPTRQFEVYSASSFDPTTVRSDLALSLDVIYHLVEDAVYDAYMQHLFATASRYVIIYSSNRDGGATAAYIRHRCFTDWVTEHAPAWRLAQHIPNAYPYDPARLDVTSFADFFVFEPKPSGSAADA